MSDEMDELGDPWPWLYYGVLRRAPRLRDEWGHCPACFLPATHAGYFCGLVWCACATCLVRWPVRDSLGGLLELDPMNDERTREYLDLLAQCIDLDPLPAEIPSSALPIVATILREETFPMKQNPTTPKSYGIDPRRFQGPKENKVFASLTDDQCIRVTDCVLRDLREYPLIERHPLSGKVMNTTYHAMWTRIRDIVIDDKGTTVGRVLQNPAIPAPPFALRDCIALFLDLREKRAELAARLADLDIIESAFASAPAAVAS